MVKKEVDWAALRRAYEAGEGSYRTLGEAFGISVARIAQVAKQEGWGGRRRRTAEDRETAQQWLCEAAQDLCAEAREIIRLSRVDRPSVKELKEMAAVLKDLVSLQQSLEGGGEAQENCLRIVMEDEVAKWSE